jgi:hypothetical protein
MKRTVSVGAGIKREENDFKYATNYFTEEYIDSDDALRLLPSDFNEPDGDIDNDDYVNEALEAIDSPNWITSVSPGTWVPFGPPRSQRAAREARRVTNTDLTVYIRREKRFVKALMTGIANFLTKCTAWLVRTDGVRRLRALKEQGGFKVAEKFKGAQIADQRNAGNQIRKSKNWENCLRGKRFEKY